MGDPKLAKIVGGILQNARDLAEWGLDTGTLTEDDLRLEVLKRNPTLRALAAKKMIASGMSQRQAAKALGVSNTTVVNDLAESGKKLTTRDVKEAEIKAINANLKLIKPKPAINTYSTIVIDPPWEMEKIKRDVAPNQVGFDYPTMSEDELEAFPVRQMAAEDCHLFCWTTHKYLPMGLRLIEVWGFKYVLLLTWHKSGGFQPFGLPQYNSEFVVYGRRGAPKFRDTQAFNTCFQGERREHSRKPDVFYDTVRRVTGDGRIDVFSREAREGFEQYGNETGKFVPDQSATRGFAPA